MLNQINQFLIIINDHFFLASRPFIVINFLIIMIKISLTKENEYRKVFCYKKKT